MKYALISDIHGNYPALKAVIDDAKSRNVYKFLFLGDYYEDLPWPNEVVDAIRTMESAIVVRGNKEDYLVELYKRGKSSFVFEQMAAIYWNYEELTPDNLKYLISLPDEARIRDENGEEIFLSHSSPLFYRKKKIRALSSYNYSKRMRTAAFSHEDYLKYARESVLADTEAVADLETFAGGVNVFGHNHLQWHMYFNETLHVNPGSCGMPLDFNTGAPYTIIESAGGDWIVTELRIPYDVKSAITELMNSTLYKRAEAWSKIMVESLTNAEDIISYFLRHLNELAKSMGYPHKPVSNEIWRLAVEQWEFMNK